jgi:OPA family sugar phosphate sensor protein UhpC-like MFS transporter
MYFCRKNFDAVKKSMGAELNLSDLQLGHIDTAFLVAYAVGQFAVGPFGDRYGARRMLAVSLLGGGMACACMSRAVGFDGALAAWAANGFFQAMGFPLIMKALAPWFTSRQRGTVLGFWTTSQQVGGTLAASFSGFVASGGITAASLIFYSSAASASTWRDAFSLPAVFSVATALFVYLVLIESPEDVGLNLASATNSKQRRKQSGKNASDQKSGFF